MGVGFTALEEKMTRFTDESAAWQRTHGTDPELWDAAGEYERLRAEGMTPEQANVFMATGKAS
jgi:hypothetical protein